MYKALLKEDGLIHLKTDSEFLHGYTLGLLQGLEKEIVYSNHDIYRLEGSPQIVTSVQTFYEKQYLETKNKLEYIQQDLLKKSKIFSNINENDIELKDNQIKDNISKIIINNIFY